MRSGQIPSRIQRTASLVRPQIPGPAKGAPLSVRITRGSPYCLNACSKTVNALSSWVLSSPSHRMTNLLNRSVIVSG